MKRLLYPITFIIMMLCAITAEAQLPLNVISQREYDNKPADNSLFAQRENQQRQMIRASRAGFLFRAPEAIRRDNADLGCFDAFDDLRDTILSKL